MNCVDNTMSPSIRYLLCVTEEYYFSGKGNDEFHCLFLFFFAALFPNKPVFFIFEQHIEGGK